MSAAVSEASDMIASWEPNGSGQWSDHHLPSWYYSRSMADDIDVSVFESSFHLHSAMISVTGNEENVIPLCYVRIPSTQTSMVTINSATNMSAEIAAYYEKIESQLLQLNEAANGEEEEVEAGAVGSALAVVEMLKRDRYAPPALSWHGGDAVVMLWAIADTTYAITVTEGELGYVVRRDRKQLKSGHSIALNSFRLSDLR